MMMLQVGLLKSRTRTTPNSEVRFDACYSWSANYIHGQDTCHLLGDEAHIVRPHTCSKEVESLIWIMHEHSQAAPH